MTGSETESFPTVSKNKVECVCRQEGESPVVLCRFRRATSQSSRDSHAPRRRRL